MRVTIGTAVATLALGDPPVASPPCHRCKGPADCTIHSVDENAGFVLCAGCLFALLGVGAQIERIAAIAVEAANRPEPPSPSAGPPEEPEPGPDAPLAERLGLKVDDERFTATAVMADVEDGGELHDAR